MTCDFSCLHNLLWYVSTPESCVLIPKACVVIGAIRSRSLWHVRPYTLYCTPCTLHPTHYTLHTTHYTLYPTPYTLNGRWVPPQGKARRIVDARREAIKVIMHHTSNTLHPAPYTMNHTPYTLKPTPYTLHPAPHTMNHTPYTIHPTPSTQRSKSLQPQALHPHRWWRRRMRQRLATCTRRIRRDLEHLRPQAPRALSHEHLQA